MDIISAFKSELLRPLATLVVPGSIAIGPYIIIIGYYIPQVSVFWNDHPSAFISIVIITVLAFGMILEDIGSRIESSIWDRLINNKDQSNRENWSEYLKLKTQDEILGQRYLRTVLIRMKFELSMTPALILFYIGLIWVNSIHRLWSLRSCIFISIIIIFLTLYLLWESFESANVLARTRKLVIEAIKDVKSKE